MRKRHRDGPRASVKGVVGLDFRAEGPVPSFTWVHGPLVGSKGSEVWPLGFYEP